MCNSYRVTGIRAAQLACPRLADGFGLERANEQLTDFGEWPSWSNDSRRVLFVNKGAELWVLDTRTRQTRTVYSTTRDVPGPPRMRPERPSVFFSRRVNESDIYLFTFE